MIFILVTSYILINKKICPIHQNKNASIKDLILMSLPYLIFVPVVIASFIYTKVQIGSHGGFHVGYVYQILQGIIPPENVVLPGYEANIYWLYHALIAAIVNISNISAPLVSTILNLFALIGSFYWINKTLIVLEIRTKNQTIISCYAIFILLGLNLFAPLHFLMTKFTLGVLMPDNFMDFFIKHANIILAGDTRLTNILMKYFDFNSTTLGIMYFLGSFYYALIILKDKLTLKYILFLMLLFTGALIFHATTALFILITFPLAMITTIFYFHKNNLKDLFQAIKAYEWIILFVAAIVLLVPILHYVYLAAIAMPPNSDSSYTPLISILASTYPLIALLLIALYLKTIRINKIHLFLILVSLLGYIYTFLVYLPDNNQYKFIFLSAIPLCTLIIISLENAYHSSGSRIRLILKGVFSILVITLSITVLLIGIHYLTVPFFSKDKSYYYEGSHINLQSGFKYRNKYKDLYKDVYDWIRKNTEENTIVILPLEAKDRSNIYLITERLPYVVCGHMFAEGIEEFHNRVENVMQFYGDKPPPNELSCRNLPEVEIVERDSIKKSEILNEFKEFNSKRPSVLFIPKNKLDDIVVDDEILKLLYRGKDANVYGFKK
ncbi:MAG: hypothetical protein WBB48_11900 [Thermodesulfobacteriota bacterium]